MMYQSLIVALLASTAVARPQHAHKHLHMRAAGTGTGAPYGTGNSTGGYYANSTTYVSVAPETSTAAEVVTVTVSPLPVSAGGSTVAAGNTAAASDVTCGGSRTTTTLTSTEIVTVTVGGAATSSATSAAVSTPSVVASSSSSSSSSSTSEVSAAVLAEVSSTSSAASTSYSTSYAAASSSSAVYSSAVSSTAVQAASVSSSATSTSSSATTSSTSSASNSKRGLAFNEASLTSLFSDSPVSWAYNWGSSADGTILSSLEFVPMMWCPGKISQDDWNSAAQSAIDSGSEHLLSFNEPDQSSQCNIDAATAAADHISYMNPFSGKAKIGSPAVTNGGGSMGLTYMSSFLEACDSKCDIDFLAIHWYSGYSSTAADDFKSHVSSAIELASQNGIDSVWITEFALNGASDSDTASFLEEVLPWMDSQSAVGRYAFFMCAEGLLTSGSAISDVIGNAYITSS